MRRNVGLVAGGGASVLLLAGTLGLASPAQATAGTCLGQTITINGTSCTIEPGESLAFVIQGADGGNGGSNGSFMGGNGGVGSKVSGEYTNTNVTTETLMITVGTAGTNGANASGTAQAGTGGNASSFSQIVGSIGGVIVRVGAGTGGTGASTSAGNAGFNGNVIAPVSLPAGWTTITHTWMGANGSVVFTAGSGGGSNSGDSGPAPVFQEFGKPATGTCADAAPSTLNWAGVTSGGWGTSWSQWMNAGTGGAVCTRTLVYSLELAKWIVG